MEGGRLFFCKQILSTHVDNLVLEMLVFARPKHVAKSNSLSPSKWRAVKDCWKLQGRIGKIVVGYDNRAVWIAKQMVVKKLLVVLFNLWKKCINPSFINYPSATPDTSSFLKPGDEANGDCLVCFTRVLCAWTCFQHILKTPNCPSFWDVEFR